MDFGPQPVSPVERGHAGGHGPGGAPPHTGEALAQVKRLCQWAEQQVAQLEQMMDKVRWRRSRSHRRASAAAAAAATARADHRCRRFCLAAACHTCAVSKCKSGVGPGSGGTGDRAQDRSVCGSLAFHCRLEM